MALARDDNGNAIQVLAPIDGTLQRLTPTAGNATRIGTPITAKRAKVIGVRVRSAGGVAHVRLGDDQVAALVSDFPLTIDDGWMFFAVDGKSGTSRKTVTHVSIYAETANVSADIVEME